jgi:uroporphyrin-III C-methyltransferase / precorrin-2 dehydrogenase / sirohydrochlorin ferrochelatase
VRYPLFLDLTGRRVVVVGGGTVAARRSRALHDAGAHVVVVAPSVGDEVYADERREAVFTEDALVGAWLVVACTDDSDVNAAVAAAADTRGIWCSRADDATESRAWVPASGAVDDVQIAVTAGGDPGRARTLRDDAVRALHVGDWRARRTRTTTGRVVLVGGGPGDPGLLTMRGYRALLDADVVVADRLGPAELVGLLPADVEVVDVGKDPRGHAASQDDINVLLVQRALAGEVVARLKGGDPFVLGRGSEEVEACVAAGVAVEVIPGVSSVTAAPALAGVPLTKRGTSQQFTVVSGHVPPGDPRSTVDWDAVARGEGTIVLLMAVANLRPIADTLMAAGRDRATAAVVIENASLPDQRLVRTTLADLADSAEREDVVPPAVVVIGGVVSPRDGAGARP